MYFGQFFFFRSAKNNNNEYIFKWLNINIYCQEDPAASFCEKQKNKPI